MKQFPYNIIDLTHEFSSETPTWDGGCGFNHERICDYNPDEKYQFRIHKIQMNEGIGTHMDSPAHCIQGGKKIHDLDLNDLASPCVVIDISDKAHERYSVSADDIKDFEATHEEIQAGTFVIVYSGWSNNWNDKDKYRNNLLFPSYSEEAALLLLERDVSGIGIDTLSPDREEDGFPVHKAILGAGKYIVENIANATKIPVTGAYSLTAPLKIKDGTEAPVRLMALVPK